jgi:hypothetical protein
LLAVYKNKKYKTISVPLSLKAEIEKMLEERGTLIVLYFLFL